MARNQEGLPTDRGTQVLREANARARSLGAGEGEREGVEG